jgi:hypothetical protein
MRKEWRSKWRTTVPLNMTEAAGRLVEIRASARRCNGGNGTLARCPNNYPGGLWTAMEHSCGLRAITIALTMRGQLELQSIEHALHAKRCYRLPRLTALSELIRRFGEPNGGMRPCQQLRPQPYGLLSANAKPPRDLLLASLCDRTAKEGDRAKSAAKRTAAAVPDGPSSKGRIPQSSCIHRSFCPRSFTDSGQLVTSCITKAELHSLLPICCATH